MARRAVTNLLGLAVLGTLAQRPMHRYEIAMTIREQGKDEDMDVKWGSLYTVVKNLERHGLVEATGTDRAGARPERTTYRITGAGLQEMADWTRDLVRTPAAEHRSFTAGLSMIAAVPPAEAVVLLRERMERLESTLREERTRLDREGAGVPRLFLVEDEYGMAMQAAEIAWIRGLLDELEAGTFPDLATWQHAHETGPLDPSAEGGEPETI